MSSGTMSRRFAEPLAELYQRVIHGPVRSDEPWRALPGQSVCQIIQRGFRRDGLPRKSRHAGALRARLARRGASACPAGMSWTGTAPFTMKRAGVLDPQCSAARAQEL